MLAKIPTCSNFILHFLIDSGPSIHNRVQCIRLFNRVRRANSTWSDILDPKVHDLLGPSNGFGNQLRT